MHRDAHPAAHGAFMPRSLAQRASCAPRRKLCVALALILAVSLAPLERGLVGNAFPVSWVAVLVAAGAMAALVRARVPLRMVLRRVLWFLPPWLALSATLALSHGARGGAALGVGIVGKGLACYVVLLWLTLTTPPEAVFRGLRRLGLPSLLVDVLGFVYRYSFVLRDELDRMHCARMARTFDNARRARWRTGVSLVGMLLVRSYDRAQRVYAAMRARRF